MTMGVLESRISYNISMTDKNNEMPPIVDGETDAETNEATEPKQVVLPAEFVATPTGRAVKWDSGSRPGKWATIGCGLGLVVLIAALFAGSSMLKKTVWAGFAGTSNRLVANLPGDLAPGERMRLTRNLGRFTAQAKLENDSYEAMGEFQRLARGAMEDNRITAEEVEEINVFLESQLPDSKYDVPYSMP
jgi:hypothetical protein